MSDRPPVLPTPRGHISEAIIDALDRAPGALRMPRLDRVDVLESDDAQLALWCCYELHYSSFAESTTGGSGNRRCSLRRGKLERRFVGRIVDEIGPIPEITVAELAPALLELAAGAGPSLSGFLYERGTRLQMREFLVHRSIYQRKEADPHTWAIPRLRGRAKAAMVTIQNDEYGDGVTEAMHAELFATTMARSVSIPRSPRTSTSFPGRRSRPTISCRCSGCTAPGAPRASGTSRSSR